MIRDSVTTSLNPTVNRQLLEHTGMSTSEATALAAAMTALDGRYRLEPTDTRVALQQLQAGMSLSAIAAGLRTV
jgi:hypothetical protein